MALNTGNPYLDALGGSKWSGPQYYAADGALLLTVYFDNDTSAGHSTGGAWEPAEESAFWDALHAWTSVANVRFLQVDNAGAADVTLRKVTDAELPDGAAQADYPDSPTHIMDFNADYHWTAVSLEEGGFTFETFLHELGHVLGLAHPHDDGMGTGIFPGVDDPGDIEGGTGDFGLNAIPYTVMSYNEAPGSDPDEVEGQGFAASPLAFDIAAIQRLYGMVNNNTGDTVYALADEGPGTSYFCIWDTGGNDTIRYDGEEDATIDLRYATLQGAPGGGGFLSQVDGVLGGLTIAAPGENMQPTVVIENAIGGSGDDTITGNEFDNHLEGGGGQDTLTAGGGDDSLTGGSDWDTYVFADGWGNDTIADFEAGTVDAGDVLHLRGVSGLGSLSQLVMTDTADGLRIEFAGNSIVLNGVAKGALDGVNFNFIRRASDGYISGATVFADANGNGLLDAGEASATTDATGTFALVNEVGTLIAFGGTDTSTGLPIKVRLTAPEHSIVITALTTLLVAGAGQSNLLAALNLPAGFDLTLGDPIAALLAGDAGSASVFAAGAKVIDTVIAIATAVAGLGGDEADAQEDAFAVIASTVNNLGAGATLDLSNAGTIAGLFGDVAGLQGIDASALAAAVAAAVAASNAAIDGHLATDGASQALLTNVSAVQGELQANQSPDAVNDSVAVVKGKTLLGNVLTNDSDPDGDAIEIVHVSGGTLGAGVAGTFGTLTLEADGDYSYLASKKGLPAHILAQDSFTYGITDGLAGAASATLSVMVLNPGQKYQAGANTTLTGGNGKDVLDGSAGGVMMIGGKGTDFLIGGPDGTLAGGKGMDVFVFRPDFGMNIITDFELNGPPRGDANFKGDVIQIDASVFQSIEDLFAHASDTAAGVLIDDGDGNAITIAGVNLSQLHASDFYLV